MSTDAGGLRSGSEYVYQALVDAGIETVIGIPGAQTVPLDRLVIEGPEIEYVMARHETAIPHIAWGYFEAGGTMAATVTIPGPGDTNMLTGLKNALSSGVPILHLTSEVNPEDRDREPIHEIEPDTFDNAVKENISLADPLRLPEALARAIATAREPPYGPVRVGVPKPIIEREFYAPPAVVEATEITYDNDAAYARAAALLADAERPLVFVGGGARRTPDGPRVVRELVEELDAPAVSSYSGKGVFPENDPHALGVTGKHLPAPAVEVIRQADVVVALGTDFDVMSTNAWTLPVEGDVIQVDVDPSSIGNTYPPAVPIVADIAAAVRGILTALEGPGVGWAGGDIGRAVRKEYEQQLREAGALADEDPTTTPAALQAVRAAIPEDALVTVDVGAFRLWAAQTFEARTPEQFITSGSWGGMGHGLPSAIGAKLAAPDRPVVALTGDGGLYMGVHELHTAVEVGADVTAVVFNDGGYGSIINKSPEIDEDHRTHAFAWDRPDLAGIAEGFGWTASVTSTPAGVREAVATAVADDRPHLVDVHTKPNELAAVDATTYDSELDLTVLGRAATDRSSTAPT